MRLPSLRFALLAVACSLATPVFSQRCVGPFGGPGRFNFDMRASGRLVHVNVNTAVVNNVTIIRRLGFTTEYADGSRATRSVGSSGGPFGGWNVPNGHLINRVEVWAGTYVVRLKFHTDKGASWQVGGTGGVYHNAHISTQHVIGFRGQNGTYINNLAVCFDYRWCDFQTAQKSGCTTNTLRGYGDVWQGRHRISLELTGAKANDPLFWAFGPPISPVPLPQSSWRLVVNPLIVARTSATGNKTIFQIVAPGDLKGNTVDVQVVRVATLIPTTFDASNSIRITCK